MSSSRERSGTAASPRGGVTAEQLLIRGAVKVRGRMPRSSNATFLVEVTHEATTALAVYKPQRGERPLWDFPPGLDRRELAAYRLSQALGWSLVPLTVQRTDAPYGEGSLQAFVDADFRQHYFTLLEDEAHHERLQQICVWDLLANNADRKAGHCLLGSDNAIYAVDNGLCFHAEPKLRTVIWEFGGRPIPDAMLRDVRRLIDRGVPKPLAALLSAEERAALLARAREVAEAGEFPIDTLGRYPWPLV
jgi:uncharacterized repeat protein (TIGR03843 family)